MAYTTLCSFTSLSILGGDKVVLVLLGPGAGAASGDRGSAYTSVYENYLPYCEQFYGVFDAEYGRLASVESSTTTEFLELAFRRPALDVLNAVVGSDDNFYAFPNPIRELYLPEKVSRIVDSWVPGKIPDLTVLGFTRIDTAEGFGASFTIDGCSLHLVLDSNKISWRMEQDSLENAVSNTSSAITEVLSEFALRTGFFPGVPAEDVDAVSTLTQLSAAFVLEKFYEAVIPLAKASAIHEMTSYLSRDLDYYNCFREVSTPEQLELRKKLDWLKNSEGMFFVLAMDLLGRMIQPALRKQHHGGLSGDNVVALLANMVYGLVLPEEAGESNKN